MDPQYEEDSDGLESKATLVGTAVEADLVTVVDCPAAGISLTLLAFRHQ